MTYELYRYIFMGGAVLTAIMLVVSVLLFIGLRIPTVIGDLSGSNARKAIANIRSRNENTGDKTYRSSHVNLERGKLTDKITSSGRLIKNPSHSLHGAMATEKISTQRLTPHGVGAETSETTVLTDELSDKESKTTVLTNAGRSNETTVLTEELSGRNAETTVLTASDNDGHFVVEQEITYIHTVEEIV